MKWEVYTVEILWRGGGKKRYDDVVEEFVLGPFFCVVRNVVTPTGNLRTEKHPWPDIRGITTEHRPHLGSTKVPAARTQPGQVVFSKGQP